MKDKLNITIKVANQRPLRMAVSLGEEEEEVRQAEYFVNHVWAKWMDEKAADQSDSDVLAMTAIYFARLYIQEYRKTRRWSATSPHLRKHSTKYSSTSNNQPIGHRIISPICTAR